MRGKNTLSPFLFRQSLLFISVIHMKLCRDVQDEEEQEEEETFIPFIHDLKKTKNLVS